MAADLILTFSILHIYFGIKLCSPYQKMFGPIFLICLLIFYYYISTHVNFMKVCGYISCFSIHSSDRTHWRVNGWFITSVTLCI